MKLSKAVTAISPSATISIAAKAKRMKKEGVDVISFATGEPDFPTPDFIKHEAWNAIQENFTKYTAVNGIEELREAVCEKLEKENNISYSPDQILISNGAKQALFNAFRTVVEEGDQVLVASPAYVSFIEQIKLAGGEPVIVPTCEKEQFRLKAESVKARITAKTKVILINSPNNPTGAVYAEKELDEIGRLAVENDLILITDEVYEKICYGNSRHVSIPSLNREYQERCILVNAVSKTYAMTGWRLGYAAGPRDIIRGMTKLQGHITGNVNSITQKASVLALRALSEDLNYMNEEYARRRESVIEIMEKIPKISFNHPDGAFYFFINIKKLLTKENGEPVFADDIEFADYLLEEANVAVVPGTAFSCPGYLRISYALEYDLMVEGIQKMKQAIEKLVEVYFS